MKSCQNAHNYPSIHRSNRDAPRVITWETPPAGHSREYHQEDEKDQEQQRRHDEDNVADFDTWKLQMV